MLWSFAGALWLRVSKPDKLPLQAGHLAIHPDGDRIRRSSVTGSDTSGQMSWPKLASSLRFYS